MAEKISVAEFELLTIVDTLIDFNGMLWRQRLTVYMNHKNWVQAALGLTSDLISRWRLLIEEYSPENVSIKGMQNTVSNAIS